MGQILKKKDPFSVSITNFTSTSTSYEALVVIFVVYILEAYVGRKLKRNKLIKTAILCFLLQF